MTATILDLFEALGYRPGERVSICHKAPGRDTPFIPRVVSVAEAAGEVAAHAGYADVWWGVNPVDPTGGRGTVEDVTRWAALYADLDVKPGGMASLEAAQSVIDELSNLLGVLPVAVTFSGHGLQPYWALDPDDPETDLTDCDRRRTAQVTMRRFGRLVAAVASRMNGHVDSVFDLTRVLRAPGTVNRKGQPVAVVTSLMQGSPLTVERITEVLAEYGIASYADDAKTPGEMVSNPEGWTWATSTCQYVPLMVEGWRGDRPLARHPWFMGQTVRLAIGRRLGCFTEADYRAAMSALNRRMAELVTTTEPVRRLAPGELEDGHAWAVAQVAAMSDSHLRHELGGHKHERAAQQPPLRSVPPGGFVTDGIAGAVDGQQAPPMPPAWAEVDLTDFLNDTYEPLQTALFQRSDGFHLLYRGRVHSFHGESESGKSWLALHAVAERLLAGGRAAMIDFESNAHTVVGRLLSMGVPRDAIRDRFSYRNPDVTPTSDPREQVEWEKLLASHFDVLVLDGITEALSVFSASSKDNDEVTTWIREIARRLAFSTGAAVIMVDHVTKDADTRGRFAIGGQAKMAALDGAAYVIEPIEPLGIGMVGRVSMRVAKDRNGLIRPKSGPYRKSDRTQETAVVHLDASQDGTMVVRVEMFTATGITDPETGETHFQPTALMERVSRYLETIDGGPAARNRIIESVYGKKAYITQAIDCLIEDDYLAADGPALNGGRPSIRLVRPYREGGDPVPDLDPSELVLTPGPGTPTRSRSKDPGPGDRVGSPSETRSGDRVGTGSGPGLDDTLDLGLEGDPDD